MDSLKITKEGNCKESIKTHLTCEMRELHLLFQEDIFGIGLQAIGQV